VKTTIIAEAGVNHNGDLARALALVDAAADAGADVVKFQTFRASALTTAAAPKAQYQVAATKDNSSQRDMLAALELDRAAHDTLIAHCQRRGIEFLSTAFDPESLTLLIELGLRRFKIPSGELTNLPFLRRIAATGAPIILSTGMATLGEIEAALNAIEQAGTSRDAVTVLHCTTEYPTAPGDVNLRAMATIRDAFGVAVGYSDHTRGIEVPIAAVALGATMIEKHVTLDCTLPGPDHAASAEPAELAAMVRGIRVIEEALGDGIKRPTRIEQENRVAARKSLVAAVPIRKGELLTAANLAAKRPGSGISPMRWDDVVGRVAARDFLVDEPIEL
jgi:N,N'-diacetyllegionaminate synthase